MNLPFRRARNASEVALSSYWDDLALTESSGEVFPVNVDPDLASAVRQLERLAATAIPQADFADRMLGDLLGKQREEMAMQVTRPGAQSRTFSQSPAKPLPFPEVRRGLGYIGAAAVMLLLFGAIAFLLSRQSDPDSPPPALPAVVQEGSATPDGSPADAPAVMVNPDDIETIWQWDLPAEDNQNDGFDQYLRVAVSPDGEIYAVEPDADAKIHLLDASGTQTGIWGGPGQDPGTFNFGLSSNINPLPGGDIDFDAEGNIYVFDSGNDRIQKFSPDRQFLTEWAIEGSESVDYNRPLGAVDPVNEKIYVVTELYPRVQVFDLEGNLLASWGEFGGMEGQFRAPSDVAVAPDGTVWISDKGISRIQHFDADGNYLGVLGGERGGEPGQFNQVTNLFIDDAYNIYVADFGNGRIQVVRPDGTPLLAFNLIGGTDRIAGAYSLWVDDDGSLFVADSGDDRVLKLQLPPILSAAVQEGSATPESSSAATPAVMVNPDSITSPWQWDLPLEKPSDQSVDQYLRVAVSPAGEIYAVDTIDATIHLLDTGGVETGTWGEIGTGPRQFNFNTQSYLQSYGGDIDFDAEGNIYVFDSLNNRIQKYSPNRQFLKEWSVDVGERSCDSEGLGGEEGAVDCFPLGAVDPVNEKVYVVAQLHPKVLVFDLEGNLLTSWGEYGGKEGQFRYPSDVAVAPDGTVWISDYGISRIQHFDSDGNYLGMLGGEPGVEPGHFNQVTGLFIDDVYNIYVADFGNGRIQVVRPDGTPLLAFDLIGGTDRIAGPYSLWVDDDGSLYVADSRDDRLLKILLPPLI